MIPFDPPAELPGNLKDQLRALAPYMHSFTQKANGGFVIELSIPCEDIAGDFDHAYLAKHKLKLSGKIDPPVSMAGVLMFRSDRYIDFTLEYL